MLGGLFLVTGMQEEPRPPSVIPLLVELLLGLAGCLALALLRRRRPVALTLALILLWPLAATLMGPTALALFGVAVRRRWRTVAIVAALHAASVLGVLWLAPLTVRQYWESVVTILLLDAVLVASGMFVRAQRMLVESLRERARQAEEEQRLRVEEARHLERERLAREMHDVLAHRISLLAVHAGALEFRRDAPDEERRVAAGVIRRCAHDALEDLREVIGMLRENPATDDPERPQPTLGDLPALVEQARRAGSQVTVETGPGELPDAPAGIGRHAYRIVQEGLTNARKHAPGAPVRVTVSESAPPAGGLAIEISNPLARPADGMALPGAGAGLIGLRERVALLGGRLEHGQTAAGEFRLRAWLPWRP